MALYHGNLVNWISLKQSDVALSTCQAELTAIRDGTTEAEYFRHLLTDLLPRGFSDKIIILNDNQPAINTLQGGGEFKCKKHYLTRINYIIDQMERKAIYIHHTSTKDMIADSLTKPLSDKQLRDFHERSSMHF